MTAQTFCRLAERIMRIPAVAYHEHAVRTEVELICRENDLSFRRDRFGNLFVTLKTDSRQRPLVLAAHMDHPGFEITGSAKGRKLHAEFLGGVPDSYFREGIRLRTLPGNRSAVLGRRIRVNGKGKRFEIRLGGNSPDQIEYAVWDLPDFLRKGDFIHGRACDDLIGVTNILATLIELRKKRAKVHVIGVISRAEEVGFHGALTVASAKAIPSDSIVISLETSRELPGVKMGQGVIVRVGDRASIFNSAATRFLAEVGNDLSKRRKNFSVQRALMSGGTCEATAYQEFGYTVAAVCVALGNYHNCGANNKIKAEFVSESDALGMVELLAAAAFRMKEFDKLTRRLPARLEKLLREAKPRLLQNP